MISLFYGPDTFTLSEELVEAKQQFLKHSPNGIVERLTASGDFSDSEFLNKSREVFESQGLFTQDKLIIINDFLPLAAKLPKSADFLIASAESLPKNLELIFVEAGEADERRVFFKKLLKFAKPRNFPLPEGKAYAEWVEKRLLDAGFEIAKEALAKFPPMDLWRAASELEKLMLYSGERVIQASDITDLIRPDTEENVFTLTNLFAEKEKQAAMQVLDKMLDDGPAYELKNQAIVIVGALASQIRSLLLVRSLEGQRNDEIAKLLNWKTGRVWINSKLASKFDTTRLVKMIRDLRAIDLRLKTSEESPKLLLALFLQKAAS